MVVIKASELEVENILFGKLEDSSLITSQKLAFISYKEQRNKLVVQTPEFITETYGIPREGPFYQTPKSRAFYKLPFCHERHQYAEDIDYQQVERFYRMPQEIGNTATRRTSGCRCSGRGWRRSTSISP